MYNYKCIWCNESSVEFDEICDSWRTRTFLKFIWVSQHEIQKHSKELSKRFLHASRVPGTRDNHSFIPGARGLMVSRVSGIENDFVCSSDSCATANKTADTATSLQPGTYVACLYDGVWWIGCVRSVSEKHGDYEVTFMQPMGHHKHFDGHKERTSAGYLQSTYYARSWCQPLPLGDRTLYLVRTVHPSKLHLLNSENSKQ